LFAVFIAVTISTLLLNALSPLSALYFHEPLPNPLQPATTPYDLALIQLNDYVPPNASVSVPASAVPWFSSTRYGWNEHGVPFFGPNNYTKYEVYSPFVPTGYPYGPNFNNYLPYVFNDGAWLLIGPFQRPYGFNYTTTVTLLTPPDARPAPVQHNHAAGRALDGKPKHQLHAAAGHRVSHQQLIMATPAAPGRYVRYPARVLCGVELQ